MLSPARHHDFVEVKGLFIRSVSSGRVEGKDGLAPVALLEENLQVGINQKMMQLMQDIERV